MGRQITLTYAGLAALVASVWLPAQANPAICGDTETIAISDDRYISAYDLMGTPTENLRFARNEIFARHGFIFKSRDLQDWFSSCNWYEAGESNDVTLSTIEQANVKAVRDEEKRRKFDAKWTPNSLIGQLPPAKVDWSGTLYVSIQGDDSLRKSIAQKNGILRIDSGTADTPGWLKVIDPGHATYGIYDLNGFQSETYEANPERTQGIQDSAGRSPSLLTVDIIRSFSLVLVSSEEGEFKGQSATKYSISSSDKALKTSDETMTGHVWINADGIMIGADIAGTYLPNEPDNIQKFSYSWYVDDIVVNPGLDDALFIPPPLKDGGIYNAPG